MDSDSHSDIASTPEGEGGESRHCTATKADGSPCRGLRLGDAYGDARELCTGHARAAGLLPSRADRERLGQAVGATRRKKSALELVRERLDNDPERLATLVDKALDRGDAATLVRLLGQLYSEAQELELPTSLDRVKDMTPAERQALLRRLEADAPVLVDCMHCGGPLLASDLPAQHDPASVEG